MRLAARSTTFEYQEIVANWDFFSSLQKLVTGMQLSISQLLIQVN